MRKSSIKEFAREVYSTDGQIDTYELHKKYRLSPSSALYLIALFQRIGIVEEEEDGIVTVNSASKQKLWRMRSKLFLDPRRPWADAKLDRSDPREPYLPDLKSIDKKFFINKLAKG